MTKAKVLFKKGPSRFFDTDKDLNSIIFKKSPNPQAPGFSEIYLGDNRCGVGHNFSIGTDGLVPAPTMADIGKVLTPNGWIDPSNLSIVDSLATPVTYSELVALKTGGDLVPGTQYRITDYTCTTTQDNTQSAGHVFDIIVTADSETELNENARAAHHEGDTYFSNCDLDSWELKYCLENDTNRFAWADDTTNNGKGVIYYMKDEWNNECPYDFKNIMFKRWAVTEVTDQQMSQDTLEALNDDFVFNGDTTKFQTRFGYQGSNYSHGSTQYIVNPNSTGWYYTFSVVLHDTNGLGFQNDTIEDGSIKGNNYYNDEGGGGFYDNTIKPRYNNMASDDDGIDGAQELNNIVLNGFYDNGDEQPYIYGCNNNSFGGNCHDNTFGNDCYWNSFGNNCYWNSFGNNCGGNTFGNDCYKNSFGVGCSQNSFGNYFQSNTFGNYCPQNSFGNYCYRNTFGSYCNNNSFENHCYWNSFGNSCISNSFGNDFYYNSFGNYCQHITVFDNVQCCNVTGGTSSLPVKNAQILNGTKGVNVSNKLTITFDAKKDYTQVAGLVNGTDLRIWIAEDTVTGPQTATAGHIAVFTGTDSQSGKKIIDGGVSISDLSATQVTYSELVALKTGGNLVPGMQYRIIDYTCTTTQANTQSAGYLFDIIVTADSETELNENARAAHRSGDTYFSNCDLDSWELKYCLENDTNRFAWADDTTNNGKGVIYYMKDEWNNEAPFDFKNILFTRDTTWFNNHQDWASSVLGSVPSNNMNFYFLSWVTQNNVVQDLSIVGPTLATDEDSYEGVYNNEIKGTTAYNMGITRDVTSTTFALPFTIIVNSYTFNDGLFYGCYGNSFGNGCYGNSFGNECHFNSFGDGCSENTFENNFYNNSFGGNCSGNTFRGGCYNNTFGNNCNSNSFGGNFHSNSFGNRCYSNTFGNYCSSNSFGNYCNSNSFGGNCISNSFGNYCQNNTFGNYCRFITVFDNVQYCNVTGGAYSEPIKNAQILNGTKGTSAQNKLTITFTENQDYTQVAGLVNGTTLRIWIAEDTVTGPQTAVNGNIPVFSGTGSSSGKRIIDSGVSISDLSATSVTYSELVALKTDGDLVPGTQYRIIDYTCTTTQANTQSAGHLFDIIVTADSDTELNENAKATHHSGDTYFSNCDLDSWELKYCLENDTNRFIWADDTNNGKGVIYYMKDEWNNECPYDFKNIMFKRWTVSEVRDSRMAQDALAALNNVFVFNGDATKFQIRFGYQGSNYNFGSTQYIVNPNSTGWYYTFSVIMYDVESEEFNLYSIEDGSVKGNNYYNDEGGGGFYSNTVKPLFNNAASDDYENVVDGAQELNNIVLSGYYENRDEQPYIYGCNGNNFGYNCRKNTFKNSCISNSFGNNCFQNSFGSSCYYNSFGDGLNRNSFGVGFYQNSFGNDCKTNSFGNNCLQISFGNNCSTNTFGTGCQNNSFGNNCGGNTFGNSCFGNTFGNSCSQNSLGNYCIYITVFDNVDYCNVTGGTSSLPVKNAQILNGTKGTVSNKLTITFDANKDYTQVAGLVNGTDLRIWIAEDTVTGPQTATAGHIAVFTGTDSQSGKKIIDSGVTVEDLQVDVPEYTIVEVQSQEYAKVYKLQKDGADITGSTVINIPKDMVVSAGEVKTCTQANVPVQGLAVGDKYIDLTIANTTNTHIYIPVKDLMDVYNDGDGIDIDGSNNVNINLDTSNANGLGFDSSSPKKLKLDLATQSTAGAMSAADKVKLDSINGNYWGSQTLSAAASYITTPEFKQVTINGSTTNAASTDHCIMVYDTTNKCLKFTF